MRATNNFRNNMDCDEFECSTLAKAGDCVNLITELNGTVLVSPPYIIYILAK